MTLSVDYHALARSDLYATWAWYEDQQSGLGDRFAAAVDAVVLRASRWPNSGSPTVRDEDDEIIERRLATPGFPYAVRYRVTEGTLLVVAVAHQHLARTSPPTDSRSFEPGALPHHRSPVA